MWRSGDRLAPAEFSQRLVLACRSEAATIVCDHGTLRQGT